MCLYVALTSIVYSAPVPIVLWSLNARTLATSCENGVASKLIALVAAGPYVASTSIELLRHSDPIAFRSINARSDATPVADQLSIIDIFRAIWAVGFRNGCSSFKLRAAASEWEPSPTNQGVSRKAFDSLPRSMIESWGHR